MALPENVLSTQAYHAAWLDAFRGPVEFLTDYERAGVALYDGTKGLKVKIWTGRVFNKKSVQISAEDVSWITLFSRDNNIKEIAIAFDRNMFPFVTFVEENDEAFIYWFDSSDSTQKFTQLPLGVLTPRCCIDDNRESQGAISDIVLAYIKSGSLYVRYQKDRYDTEYLLQTGLGLNARLIEVGMNVNYRLQFWLRNANPVAGAAVFSNPFLGDVVSELCKRGGISSKNIDVRELYKQNVIGYKCASDDGLNKRIDALRDVFFFDKSEVDKKITFVARGREVAAKIYYDHLVADDPSALKKVLIQEKEIPKSVSVNHLDPAGGFAKNTQTVTRKSNLINAKKETKVESEVVLTADQAMTAAVVKLKIAWHEQTTFEFATTIAYSYVVPTDVVEVQDKKGVWHRVRITERNEDKTVIKFNGVQDAGQNVYSSLGIGNSLPNPVSTSPGLIGETHLEILNIPCLKDQDDELGIYIAVCGNSTAWYGSQILISTDEGVNFFEAMEIQTPATIGETLTDLEEEISSEYVASQSVEVLVNFPLESVTRSNLLNNINRCVIGDEILQFQFATLLSTVSGSYHYRLSGLIRGRYATVPEFWPERTRFVLLDSSVEFLQAQQWMLGKEIQVKPVSLGLTEDETVSTSYEFNEGVSQKEFPVYRVVAKRDAFNNVNVSFIGRGRLGIETSPRNGKYFLGYRIRYSDGFYTDTFDMQVTRSSCPVGLTVQVCALNSITGEGPYSENVPT